MGRVCWIGLQQNPNTESTQWTWSDGSALDFGFDDEGEPLSGDDSPWQSEQPDLVAEPGSDDTNCVVLSREEEKDGKWGVVSCNELKPTYYALCGMCISTDCAVDCSGDEFAVWPMPEIVKEMEKPSTTQETASATDTEELDEDGRSSRSIGGEEEEADQETEETKQLDDLDIPEGSTTAPSAAQIRNSEIDDFENTDDSSNDESGDSEDEDETEDVYSNESGELYESDINEDSEDESKDDSDDDESAAEDESTDVAPDDESDINEDNISNEHDSDDDKANDSEHDSKDDMINAPTSSPTFEIVECIVDADCDGYRMECNKYAQCAQMTSGTSTRDDYPRLGRAAQAVKGKQEQMNVFRSRVIYVDDIKAMLSNPIWLSGVVLLLIGLIVLVARPMYSCWARSEYKRVATQFDVEHGYQSCV